MINIDCNSNFKKSDKWKKLYTNKTNFGYCPLNRGCPLNMVSRLIQVSLYNDPSERRLFLASIIYHLFNNRWQRPCNLSHSQHPQCYRRWWGVIWMPCCWRPDSYNSLVTWERSAFLVIFVREWRANHFLNEAWRRRNLLLQSCEQIRSQGCTCNIECWKRYYLGPVHTCQEVFESATFSLRIRLLSTHIRCIRHTNPFARVEIFEYTMNPESRGR